MLSNATSKSALRKLAKAYRDGLSAEERKGYSRNVAERFGAAVEVSGRCVALFDPIGSEIDASLIQHHVLNHGGKLCLPRTMKDAPLKFVSWTQDTSFIDAGFGTRAPAGDNFVVPDIVVVPMLAFDRLGNRVGYGQGHYDRTIVTFSPKPLLVGLAFHGQEAAHIDAEAHDVPLDLVVTDQAVIRVNEKGRF